MTFWKWSKTAASNATADSTSTWPEGMAASSVNDSARGLMAAAAKYRDDEAGTLITSGGSSNAYTATTNQTITSLQDGFKVSFIANHTNDGAATLAVDSQTAKPLRVKTGTAIPSGAIVSGSVYTAAYEAGNEEWLLHGFFGDQTEDTATIKLTARSSAPSGWLLCQGQAVSRTTYAALFDAIGTTYGAGDSSTTFNIPDIAGRVVAGKESSASRLTSAVSGVDGGTLGAAGGSQSHTLTEAQLPSHTHSVTDPGHTHSITDAYRSPADIGGQFDAVRAFSGGGSATVTFSAASNTTGITIGNTGSGQAHNNVQPVIVLNYIIKF
jgi:microcystin-dependent protein